MTRRACFLGDLPPGSCGRVLEIVARDFWRRRFMDLGFTPGTLVEVVRRSPTGDPVAYRLRGVTIALRRETAALIRVEAWGEGVVP
ncbi:MAG TPA: ferrous iron transport protein A [Peptococcaceae bacterium]|nr:ferrous iron transport protein A [Peptococcaceae bacterium]